MVERVFLYRAPTTVADADEIAAWLRERIAAQVHVQDRLLTVVDQTELARDLASARVFSPYDPAVGNTMLGIVRYEERVLADPNRSGGVLYDGQTLQRILNQRLTEEDPDLDQLHIGLLDRAIGTWGDDGRWHKRVNVLGQPALISVPGLYEAPAKPESYYRTKQQHALVSGDTPPREILEQSVEGEFLLEDDPRTTDALKGYVLQAVHLINTGEAFCSADECRLANPHHQEGVVTAQLDDPPFCPQHDQLYG